MGIPAQFDSISEMIVESSSRSLPINSMVCSARPLFFYRREVKPARRKGEE